MKRLELSTLYQPIFTPGGETPFGWEGLIRGPAGSLLESPLALFASASYSGILTAMEQVAFQLLCRTFTESDPHGNLFLNVYPESLLSEEFDVLALKDFLSEIDLTPKRIVLELTEHAIVNNDKNLLSKIEPLRDLGFRFAIDDFGAGFNNFRRWIDLEPEFIKLDRCLVTNIHKSTRRQVILETICAAADVLNTRFVVEGIEEAQEAEWICKNLKDPYLQGYFFGRPQPLSDDCIVELEIKRSCA